MPPFCHILPPKRWVAKNINCSWFIHESRGTAMEQEMRLPTIGRWRIRCFFFGMVDLIILDLGLCQVLPSGKRLHNYGKLPSLIGKITINVFFFNSDIGLPESILDQWVEVQGNHCKRRPRCLFDAMAMATWINADKSHGTWISSVYSLINFQCLLELRGNVEMLQEINCTRVLPPDLSG